MLEKFYFIVFIRTIKYFIFKAGLEIKIIFTNRILLTCRWHFKVNKEIVFWNNIFATFKVKTLRIFKWKYQHLKFQLIEPK